MDDDTGEQATARPHFSVLGPVRMFLGEDEVPLGVPGVRQVLAMLLLRANLFVPNDVLAQALWDHEPATRTPGRVQSYVQLLQHLLNESGANDSVQLDVGSTGSRLAIDDSLIDVTAALRYLTVVRASPDMPAGQRLALLRVAHALWRGPAFADLGDGVITHDLAELRELRFATLEALYKAQLEVGHHHEIIDELTRLVDEYPLREPFAEQLMLALAAIGREDEAFDVYERLRDRLVDQLGIAPRPALVETYTRLRHLPPLQQTAPDGHDEVHIEEIPASSSGGGVDTAVRTGTYAVSIYLADEAGHEAIEAAVARAMAFAGAPIAERDAPVLGSWFRRMRAHPAAREIGMTAAHAAETRLVHAPDAEVTARLMEHIGPVIAALQPQKEAVLRLGAMLLVKVDDKVIVHQLTAVQQFQLDHEPRLLMAPRDILTALEGPPATNGHTALE